MSDGNLHAYLGCSKSEQWLACTPSVRLEQAFPDERSSFAAEGKEAHALGEACLRADTDASAMKEHYPQEMIDAVQVYLDYVRAIEHEHMHVEVRVDVSRWVPEGFGTSDAVLIAGKTLHVLDYKHGKGVFVEVTDNTQGMLYGLGAFNEYDSVYGPFERVVIHIVQPRMGNVASWEIAVDDLLAWGTDIRPIAEAAFKGEGKAMAGDHCGFCRARFTCRARADYVIDTYDGATSDPEIMDDTEIATLYPKLDAMIKWANDVKEHALTRVQKGQRLPGLKLVEGRSNRTYADEDMVAGTLLASGYETKNIYTMKLLGITAMETVVGKKRLTQLLDGLIIKPAGKPVLVSLEDPRSEINTQDAALAELLRN